MQKSTSVLIIEDDSISAFITERALKKAGIVTIYKVGNGAEGIDFLNMLNRQNQPLPDLILLDINMPVMNGFEFLEAIKTLSCFNNDQTLISTLSTSQDQRDIEKIKKYGVLHLTKPIAESKINTLLRYLSIRSKK
jgi:CheY-like chemotaxis protein